MKSVVTIGRSSRCDIIIPHDSVSREHARISVVGGHYVYEDVGKNGSVIGGRIIHGERISIVAGTEVLLAGKVPLPWAQVYALLPLKGARPYSNETHYEPVYAVERPASVPVVERPVSIPASGQSIGVGWAIFAFLAPIAGWIMFFIWKDKFPRRASQASTIAWISFGISMLSVLLTM